MFASEMECMEFVEKLEWYKIRDVFLGRNETTMDVSGALDLASSCKYEDALWLRSVFDETLMWTKEAALEELLKHPNDARAACFAWEQDVAWHVSESERYSYLIQSASNFERDGFYQLGLCFQDGVGCEKSLLLAKECLSCAAQLGHVSAMRYLGELLDPQDRLRWVWWGRAAWHGDCFCFINNISEQVRQLDSGLDDARPTVFAIGLALKNRVEVETGKIFGNVFTFEDLIGPSIQSIEFYEAQLKAARDAVNAWSMVGIRLNLVKDVRILIGRLVWFARDDANYKVKLASRSFGCFMV